MSKVVYFPLSSSFMAISIIGFFLSVWLVSDWSPAWSFALAFFFVLMFVASVISMSKAEPIPKHMNELAVHEMGRKKKMGEMHRKKSEPKMFKPKWYDALFIIFIVVATYYVIQALSFSTAQASPTWFLIIMTIYVIVMIWMIVDAISSTKLPALWQTITVFAILLLGPVGMFIYYFYRRTSDN